MSNWMVSETRLLEDQKINLGKMINIEDNVFFSGYAGSGKSILLLHSLLSIRKNYPEAKVCIVVFTHALIAMFKSGVSEVIDNRDFKIMTYYEFEKEPKDKIYDYIFCDETQDLPPFIISLIRSRSKKRIVIAGDIHQSIYEEDPRYFKKTASYAEIKTITQPTELSSDTIYRLTPSLIRIVNNFLPEMNILSSKINKVDHDTTTQIARSMSINSEVAFVYHKALSYYESGKSVAILLPCHKMLYAFIFCLLTVLSKNKPKNIPTKWYQLLNNYMRTLKIPVSYLGNDIGELNDNIQIMTYHSAKGLDFDYIFMPFLSDNLNNECNMGDDDEIFSRTLFMVGMTRTKDMLTLSYHGNPHHYVSEIQSSNPNQTHFIDIDDNNTRQTNNIDDDFDF